MPTTYYQTMNGRIRNQETGGTRIDYLTDALGSITATVDGTGAVERTYRYKPYGAQLTATGSGTVPGFRWTGDTGSKPGGRPYGEQYNRARHYSLGTANWSTVDPLWPGQPPYCYATSNPIIFVDPNGSRALKLEDANCGTVMCKLRHWFACWSVSDTTFTGWILQYVEHIGIACPCPGCPGFPLICTPFIPKGPFTEAWRVENGIVCKGKNCNIQGDFSCFGVPSFGRTAGVDIWSNGSFPGFGKLVTKGNAKLFSDAEVKDDNPANWPVVGSLPTKDGKPGYFDSKGRDAISRQTEYKWVCCDGVQKQLDVSNTVSPSDAWVNKPECK